MNAARLRCFSFLFFWFLTAFNAIGQPAVENSNFWPVHLDTNVFFRISYPPDWVVVQPKGVTVRFSVNPTNGPGNCNVVVRPKKEISGFSQKQLNQEIESLPQSQADWAEYVGLPKSQVRVIESRIGKIGTIPALVGVVETKMENLEGKFTRYQIVALTFKPGEVWSLNCGASSFNADEAKTRFEALKPKFNKILGSFTFLEKN